MKTKGNDRVLTAIDTNIISALWSNEATATPVTEHLFRARQEGGLVISAPVFCELLAHPGADRAFVESFLNDTGIRADHDLGIAIWDLAGDAFASYAERRRKGGGGQPKRLLVDFIVGAHALVRADRLLSLDERRYRGSYPDLEIVGDPG